MIKDRYFYILFIHFFLLASISSAHAQPRRLQFIHLTADEGLSSSVVTSVIQDHEGFMWIGTTEGLDRYDGFNFFVYRKNPEDSSSLQDNRIRTIFEDHNKNLLIGTQSGLCQYDRDRDEFINYSVAKSSPLREIDCVISKIAEDSSGNLWLATNLGLIFFDRIKNKIIQYKNEPGNPESLSFDFVETVLIDKYKRLWVSTRKGLNLFNPEKGTFKQISGGASGKEDISNIFFLDMAEDPDGDLWIGSTEGLFFLKNSPEVKNISFIHYQHDKNDKNSLSINQVKSLYIDDLGDLWIGTENGGIDLFDRKSKKFWHYRTDDYDPMSLNNESIQAIYQDKTGNLWVGTFSGGLNLALKNRDAIIHYQNLPGAPSSLSHNTITCFLEDHRGQIWIGTDGGGFNLFEMGINRFLRFKTDNSLLSSNAILCMLEKPDDQLWLGTWAGGLVHFDLKKNSMTTLTTKNSHIQDNNIFAIAEGDNDDLWLGSFEHGLIHYQIKENKFKEYTPRNSGLVNSMITRLVKLSKGRLLIGTPNCFQIFSPEDDHFITFIPDPKDENSLSNSIITDIFVENDSCIWIGTLDGLNKFNPNDRSFKVYYEKDGLPNSVIKGVILDNSGTLWVTTNKGICRFDYKKGKSKTFTKEDGVQGNEFSRGSILKTKSGSIFVGGTKGFNIIYPDKIVQNKSIPDVLITDLEIFNKSVNPGSKNSPLVRNITETKTLTLSGKLSILTFKFAVMDFTASEKNQYAYKMEGFDRDWVYSGNKREATYTNLPPGEYEFRVKGSNNDGIWNETGTSIQVIILPSWWETWWFKLIIVLIIILLFTSIYLSRIRHLNNQKMQLEKLVAIKTAELYDLNASKDKFFSIIAHDLKNPFHTILGFSEMLKEEIKTGNSANLENYAGIINNSAVQTFRLLENLLEWAKSQTGKILFNPGQVSLSELLNEEFVMLNDMAAEKNIELRRSFSENFTFIADKNMIKTVLRNLISNAIKFTNMNGTIEINALIWNRQAEISVSDNGIGMNKETLVKLFRIDANLSTKGTANEKGTGIGLFLCKDFIEKHGGKLWVESELGKGSVFRFLLPLDLPPSD